ncbi:MAG: hypothetical protein Q9160_006281 [Pyrenula sp. 1 TL-2023]
MGKLHSYWTQSFRIPKPVVDEESLADQRGKVVIVTGGYAGVGHEVSKILYKKNATVYVAGRSADKAKKSIDSIVAAHPESEGKINFLKVDLSDLPTIKASVDDFLAKESRLHVLINNAGVMVPPLGTMSPQNIDIQYATNILGPFVFTKLLQPTLHSTAKVSEPGDVRVSFAGSLGVDLLTPTGGMEFEQGGDLKLVSSVQTNYGVTKAANYFLGHLFPRYHKDDGVLYSTELQRHVSDKYPSFLLRIFEWLILYPAIFGAYTELYGAFSHELTLEKDQSAYIVPWGRKTEPRRDIVAEAERKDKDSKAEKLWTWCEKETAKYVIRMKLGCSTLLALPEVTSAQTVTLHLTGYYLPSCVSPNPQNPSSPSSPQNQALSATYPAYSNTQSSQIATFPVPYPTTSNNGDPDDPLYYIPASYNNVVAIQPPPGWDYRFYETEDCRWDDESGCSWRPDVGCVSRGVRKVAIRTPARPA